MQERVVCESGTGHLCGHKSGTSFLIPVHQLFHVKRSCNSEARMSGEKVLLLISISYVIGCLIMILQGL